MAGMRSRSLLRLALHGLLAVWMTAVAVAPVWHSGHAAPPVPEDIPGHQHAVGAWMCGAAQETIDPTVDCVLCKAQRQLSQCWSRAPGVAATLQSTAAPVWSTLFLPSPGEYSPLAPRAPPLC